MSRPACCRLVLAAALIVLPAFIAANAQTQSPTYDKSTETKVQGTISEVRIASDENVHLLLKSGNTMLDAWIGPQRYLKFLGIVFHKGDRVEAVGSRVTLNAAPVLVARELNREDENDTVTLRDDKGNPVWADWGN